MSQSDYAFDVNAAMEAALAKTVAPPAPAAPAGGGSSVDSFVSQNADLARRVSAQVGVAPEVLLGQWGLETRWGKSVIPGTNNFGNIKDPTGSGVWATDNKNGSRDAYRKYDTSDAFGDDYAGLLGRRYQTAMGSGQDAERFFGEMRRKGYAEDPDYVKKGVSASAMAARALGVSLPTAGAPAQSSARAPAPAAAPALEAKPVAKPYYTPANPYSFTDAKAAIGASMGDYSKEVIASAIDAIGSIGQAGGEVAAYVANKATGTEDYVGKNLLKGTTDKIRDTMSEGGKQAKLQANIEGDILDPSTWQLPNSAQGLAMVAANGFGSLAGTLATMGLSSVKVIQAGRALQAAQVAGDAAKIAEATQAMAAASRASKIVGAVSEGAMTGGSAADEVRDNVAKTIAPMTHEQLMAAVPVYAEAFARSGNADLARNAVVNGSARWAAGLSALAGAAGGAFNAKVIEDFVLHKGMSSMVGKSTASRLGRSGLGGAGGAAVEGFQEGMEKVGQNAGENIGTGRNVADDVTRNSLGDVLGGALVGGPLGAVGGASSRHTASAPTTATVPANPAAQEAAAKAQEPNSPLSKAATAGTVAVEASAAAAPPVAPQTDPISEKVAAIQDRVRSGSLIAALRSADSPVDTKRFLNDLAAASSPSTQPQLREQALTRLEFAMGWAEQNAPVAPAADAPAAAPSGAIAAAIADPAMQAAMSPTDRTRLLEINGLVADPRQRPEQRLALTQEAQEVIGRYQAAMGQPAAGNAPAAAPAAQTSALFGSIGQPVPAPARTAPSTPAGLAPASEPATAAAAAATPTPTAAPAPATPVTAPKVATPAGAGPAVIRKRRAQLDQLAGIGFDTVERLADGVVMRNTKTGQSLRLDGMADTQMARAAIKSEIDRQANAAASSPTNDLTEPTPGQIEAGNYKKGWIGNLNGVRLSIENPKGATRRGVGPDGKAWETTLASHYGDVEGSVGADGDPVDVFIGPRPDSTKIFVVDQQNADGSFDEHKVMMGFTSEAAARGGYLANYDAGWTGLQAVTEMTPEQFKKWVKSDATTRPAAEVANGTITISDGGESKTLPLVAVDALPEAASPDRGSKSQLISRSQAKLLQKTAAVFGKQVKFFSDPKRALKSDGFVRPGEPNTIYLNERSTISSLAVLGHELMHLLRVDNPEAYAAIAEVVGARLNDAEGFRKYYGDDALGNDAMLEELISDLNGDLMSDGKFWREVFDKIQSEHGTDAKGIIAKLAAAIYEMLDAAVASFKGAELFGSKAFIDDSKEVRAAFRDALSAYAKANGVTRTAMQAEVLKSSTERSTGDFRKSLLSEIGARVEYAKMLARQHEWAYNVGDTFLSTETGKTYKIVGRTFTSSGEKIKRGEATKLVPTYFYESGDAPPAGATRAEEDAHPGEWQRGTFREDRLLDSKTMKNLVTSRPPKFSSERQTDSPAFKKWFGDSKVVDANGEPLVVYHGTTAQFNRHGLGRGAIYYTSDPKIASAYATAEYDDGANVRPAYMKLRNPLVVDEVWAKENLDDEDGRDWTALDNVLHYAEKAGHDGMILRGVMDFAGVVDGARQELPGDQYIAFSPNQIKSATGNNGNFDARSDDVTRSSEREYTAGREENPSLADDSAGRSGPGVGEARGADARGRGEVLGDTPEYGKPRAGAVSVIGRHYSKEPRQRLSGEYVGTGLKGAERTRLAESSDPRIKRRINFYIDNGKGIRPESGVGAEAHEVRLNNIYDPRTKLIPRQADNNAFESSVLDAGFDGYMIPDATTTQGQAVLLGGHSVPVKYIGSPARAAAAFDAPPATLKKGLVGSEIDAFDTSKIPGSRVRYGTLEVPADQTEAANAEFARIGSPVRFSRERLDTTRAEYDAVEQRLRDTPQWLRAPNGEATKLTERQWVHVRTPSFTSWFGDWEKFAGIKSDVWSDDQGEVSKAVGENGEPLVVYHGTDAAGFVEFNRPAGNTRRGDLGIFTTPNLEMAKTYVRSGRGKVLSEDQVGEDADKSIGVYALFVNVRKPNEDNFEGANWDGSRQHQWTVVIGGEPEADARGKMYFDQEEAIEFAKTFVDPDVDDARDAALEYLVAAEDHYASTDSVVKEARKDGADGAIIRDVMDDGGGNSRYAGEPSDMFVVFEPNQVKSADFNNGAYSVREDDIRLSTSRGALNPDIVSIAGPVLKYLRPEERTKLRRDTAQTLVDTFKQLPSGNEMAAVAYAGKAKRGWYYNSAKALEHVFGADAPRFAALLAAMSPQTSVEMNLRNALKTWANWIEAGRPTTRGAIFEIMGRSVEGSKLTDSVLPAWVPNSVRALSVEDPGKLVLSGPKVNSFFNNLVGSVDEVTNDAWMANYAAVDQRIFSGSLNALGTDPGKGPGYLAMSAKVREAARKLTQLTGEEWTPAEVQETVWSWAKTLYELQNKDLGARELLDNKAVTDELIASTPDFRTQLNEKRNEQTLRRAGYGAQLDTLRSRADLAAERREQGLDTGREAGPFDRGTQDRLERRAAGRLEQLRDSRAAAESETRGLSDAGGVRRSPGRVAVEGRQDQGLRQAGREEDGSLSGLPRDIDVAGRKIRASHFEPAAEVARQYMAERGLPYSPPTSYAKVDPARAKRIADAYDAMKHDPQEPGTKAAFDALAAETVAQYRAVMASGLNVEFIDFATQGDPYAASPRLATEDVRDNNHFWAFSTRSGYGTSEFDSSQSPMLAETEFEISGQKALVNDLFRVVHDYFGHVKEGLGFRASGEENAWRAHSAMFSPLARRALTTETRGQNSWVNYGPFGEANRTASSTDTHYADQKVGLLPQWVTDEGRIEEAADTTAPAIEQTVSLQPNSLSDNTVDAAARSKEQIVELRKRLSILNALKKCLA